VRTLSRILILLAASTLAAGERIVRGPETILGESTALAPFPAASTGAPLLATDGDEVLMVWSARGTTYAQRLDRDGHLAAPLPVVLMPGSPSVQAPHPERLLYLGGVYCLFFNQPDGTAAMRLTRDAEVIDVRVIDAAQMRDLVRDGEEILVSTTRGVLRLREDLSILAEAPMLAGAGEQIVPSPYGTLMLSSRAPAITARFLDGSGAVRIASLDRDASARMVWSGSEFIAVWIGCGPESFSSCGTWVVTLDEQLRQHALPTKIDDNVCGGCAVGLIPLGGGRAYVTWQKGEETRGLPLQKDVTFGFAPARFGPNARVLITSQGRIITAEAALNVRVVLPFVDAAKVPITATVQAAVEETLVATASSATEAAIARQRVIDGKRTNIVTILDHEGHPLREVRIGNGALVALGHDGHDFYALASDTFESSFQKVAEGAVAVKLPVRPVNVLAWVGSGFVVMQSGWRDFSGTEQNRTRLLWLDRAGQLSLPPCPTWEIGNSVSSATVIDIGAETFIVAPGYSSGTLLRFAGGCVTGPPLEGLPHLARIANVAWQNGTWAFLRAEPPAIDVAFSTNVASGPGAWHRVLASRHNYNEGDEAIAPIAGQWLVGYRDTDRLQVVLVGAGGDVMATGLAAEGVAASPRLVPLSSGRVLAVYRRHVYEPPYAGVLRVAVAPLTFETAGRRRSVRP
jgi:hypothetical protein